MVRCNWVLSGVGFGLTFQPRACGATAGSGMDGSDAPDGLDEGDAMAAGCWLRTVAGENERLLDGCPSFRTQVDGNGASWCYAE